VDVEERIMSAPSPFEIRQHVIVDGETFVVTDRAPHGESWRYTGLPASFAGRERHFTHGDALPAHPVEHLSPSGRSLLAAAQLQPEQYDIEHTRATGRLIKDQAEQDVWNALDLWCHGYLSEADLHSTYVTFKELA
jgi:hypothetical protein